MGTRCNIRIFQSEKSDKPDFILYHHNDGYPTGVGAWVEDFIRNRFKYVLYSDYLANALLKWPEDDGYQITNAMAGDIDFYYDIFCDERLIKCYHCERRSENGKVVNHVTFKYEHNI